MVRYVANQIGTHRDDHQVMGMELPEQLAVDDQPQQQQGETDDQARWRNKTHQGTAHGSD